MTTDFFVAMFLAVFFAQALNSILAGLYLYIRVRWHKRTLRKCNALQEKAIKYMQQGNHEALEAVSAEHERLCGRPIAFIDYGSGGIVPQ